MVHLIDSLLQRSGRIHVRRVREADMTVADLHEAQVTPRRFGCLGCAPDQQRPRDAAADRPHHAGAGPEHAMQRPSPGVALGFVVLVHVRDLLICRQCDDGGGVRFIPGLAKGSHRSIHRQTPSRLAA